MPDLINFLATSGGHAYFGMAEDPAAEIARMQAGSPVPIELVAGWVMPPQARLPLKDKIRRSLRPVPHRGDWFEVARDHAVFTLGLHALELGGKPWKLRKRPLLNRKLLIDRPARPPQPHARAVVTPQGRYPSAKAAAAALGISRQAAWERASRQSPGWHFEDDDRPAPARARVGRPRKDIE